MQKEAAFATPPAAAFEDIYRQHVERVRRVAQRRGVPASAVPDVVQEVFVAVFRYLPSYAGQAPLEHWINGITRNVVRTYFRKRENRAFACEPAPELLMDLRRPEDQLEHRRSLSKLAKAFGHMTDGQREAFWLYEVQGLSGSRVAELLGVNENTVRMRMRGARRRLRQSSKEASAWRRAS